MATKSEIRKAERALNTPAVHSLVRAYLLARTFYEVTKEQVDKVWLEIMTNDIEVYIDARPGRRQRPNQGERLYDHDKFYLSSDEEAFQKGLDLADERLRAAGIKPADMSRDHCPALVARNQLSKIQNALVDEAGAFLGITADRLLSHGLDDYYKFIDLVVGAVENSPTFEHPKL